MNAAFSPFFFPHPPLIMGRDQSWEHGQCCHCLELQNVKFQLNIVEYFLGDAGTTRDLVLESQSSAWLISGANEHREKAKGMDQHCQSVLQHIPCIPLS